jgi:hypothetical protein
MMVSTNSSRSTTYTNCVEANWNSILKGVIGMTGTNPLTKMNLTGFSELIEMALFGVVATYLGTEERTL